MRLVAALAFLVMASPALAAKHAFVLANNAYDQLDDLRNTHADADAYGAAFEELGFDVTNHRDLSRAETLGAFDAFLSRVRPGDEVAFVYSGHGWSDGQGNYLVPTDAPRQGSDRRLRGQSLALRNGVNGVLDEIESLGVGLTVAVIDACRDNPFQPPEGRRSAGLSRGLAKVSPPQGTFVIFSAGEGQQALDRLPDDPPDQKLSVFSRIFVPNLTSGATLEDAISETQAEVASLALSYDGHKQHPAYYDQTLGKTCLKGDCRPQPAAVRPGPSAPSACDLQYEKAEELDACFAYEAYASSCPNHMFNAFAQSYITRNCAAPAAPELAALPEDAVPEEKGLAADPDQSALVAACDRAAVHPFHPDVRAGRTDATGVERDEIDAAGALQACRRATEAFPGHVRSLANVARAMTANTIDAEALRIARQASDLGDVSAMFLTGYAYGHGEGTAEDDAEAVRWYRKAAEQGYAPAQNNLGLMYAKGNGVPQNDAEAVRWYRKAAEQGHAHAQSNLGVMYAKGNGVQQSYADAVRWFRKAAEQGYAGAQTNLGVIYDYGHGVPEDDAEAVRWYRKAAEQGYASAQTNLGWKYETGRGVSRDPARAAALYFEALRNGHGWLVKARSGEWDRNTARALQRRLREAGVYDGPIDGAIGAGSKAAMRALIERDG